MMAFLISVAAKGHRVAQIFFPMVEVGVKIIVDQSAGVDDCYISSRQVAVNMASFSLPPARLGRLNCMGKVRR
jgi:hypothetical protein